MDVFDLSASLTLNQTEYEAGLNEAESKAKTFGSSFKSVMAKSAVAVGATFVAGLTAGIGAMKKNIIATAEYGDKVDKMSQKIGISAEAYQKWDYVMQRAGGNVDSLKMGMKTLSQQAEKGNEAFQQLGISQEELSNMSQEELFEKTVKGLSEMEAGTERTKLATELLGRAGADMGPLLNEGSDAIEEQMEIAEKYGMVMSDDAVKASANFEDSLTTMSMTMDGLRNRMSAEFLPALTQVTDGLALLFTGDMSGLEQIEEGIQGIVDKISTVLPKIMEVGGSIVSSLATAVINNLPTLVQGALTMVTTIADEVIKDLPMILNAGIQIILKLVEAIGQSAPTLIPAITEAVVTMVDTLANNIPLLISSGIALIKGLAKGLLKAIPVLVRSIPKIISSIVRGVLGGLGQMLNAGVSLVTALASGIGKTVGKVLEKARAIVTKAKEAVVNKAKEMLSAGLEIVKGVWNGISNGYEWIKSRIREWVGNVKDFIKRLFGIKSPSKWARDVIGWNIAKGMALGIEDGTDEVEDAMEDLMPDDYEWSTTVKSGGLQDALTLSMADAMQGVIDELAPMMSDSMATALEGVQVKLNNRNFGRLTREAVHGTI